MSARKHDSNYIKLPVPDDSYSFFEIIRIESEKYWVDSIPDKNVYGFQIQQNSKWKSGLSEQDIIAFEAAVGITFPSALRNFYQTMNGLTKPGIDLQGSSGDLPKCYPVFYSFPDDLPAIQEMIDWVYESTSVKKGDLSVLPVSRIFPIYKHRFMLIDHPSNPILSMYGNDIIYWADCLSKLLANVIFDNIYNVSDFESNPHSRPTIKFWLD